MYHGFCNRVGCHVDIRFGISNYKPLDYRDILAPKSIPLGVVGTERTMSDLRTWLDTCARGIAAKASNQPNLFSRFPGFGDDTPFDAKLVFDSRLERQIPLRDLPESLDVRTYNPFITEIADIYIKEAEACSERGASVIVCALPMELLDLIDPDDPDFSNWLTTYVSPLYSMSGRSSVLKWYFCSA